MTATAWLAALTTATFAALIAARLVPARRRLHARVAPYTQVARSRLGVTAEPTVNQLVGLGETPPANPLRATFEPIVRHAATTVGNLIDAADRPEMERRLRQAGMADLTVEQYRTRQLATTVAGIALGATTGLLLGRGAGLTLVLMVCVAVPATTYWRNRVLKAIEARAGRMAVESYTVAQLLAVLLRTGHAPTDAVRTLVRQGDGHVIGELRQALEWTGGGLAAPDAYRRLADEAADPAVARLYRLLATGARSGGDIATALLVLAEDIRSERRQELARHAARRRMAMVAPTLLLIAPVMLLFIAAAIPHIVFRP